MQTLLSDYIGKQVIKANGEYAGYVTGVELSKKLDTLRSLACADLEEDEFTIPPTAIKAFGDGGIIVKSLGGKLAKERISAPVGMRVLTVDGNFLGYVSDFETMSAKITKIILSNGEKYPLYKIKGLGECVILDLNAHLPVAKTLVPKNIQTASEEERFFNDDMPLIQNNQTVLLNEQTTIQNNQPTFLNGQPLKKVTAGSNLLTGKKVPCDIFDVRGNLIIKKGSVITPDTLKSAIFHNKLFELTITVLNA